MLEKPKFIQGLYPFEGRGLETPAAFEPPVNYKVPFDKRSQLIYLRAGNSCAEMIYLLLKRDGKPMRYFPIGAKGAIHVPLAVVEDILPDSVLEVLLAAPNGIKGAVLLDIGLVEI
ncbi:MAG: molybdopterin oxidoreductase [Acidobacteriota bacterium]|nr:molybdopterin oxidoreductase [Acidobacteriota bacterium]